jgi:hypothetical protein
MTELTEVDPSFLWRVRQISRDHHTWPFGHRGWAYYEYEPHRMRHRLHVWWDSSEAVETYPSVPLADPYVENLDFTREDLDALLAQEVVLDD